jgi:DNA-binding NarL/FixJ family response regulator
VVDDHAAFRQLICSNLQNEPGLLVVGEASDGQAAVQDAKDLLPDLILLDIGLPVLNGIEAARQIREIAPGSKILFLSENRSIDVVREALRSGGEGYLLKSNSANELLPAILSALQGNRYIDSAFAGRALAKDGDTHGELGRNELRAKTSNAAIARYHEAGFFSDHRRLLEEVTVFLGSALLGGNSAVVIATEECREALLPRLKSYGVDIAQAIEQGRYIAIDAADALSQFMVNGMPDPGRLISVFGDILRMAENAAVAEHPRVAAFGECAPILCAEGNAEAAIETEKLANGLADKYHVDILCGYSADRLQSLMDAHIRERICAEHSAIRSDSESRILN